jgi:hypothetical protein
MILQQLLTEAGAEGIGQDLVVVDPGGVEVAADWDSLWSPENYLGYARTEHFASPDGAVLDTPQVYAVPGRLRLNQWGPLGRLDDGAAGHRAECPRWGDRLPVPRPRPAPGHGTASPRDVRAVPRLTRRAAAGCRPQGRR